ncbi:hypothetical protein AAFC00_004922 [Neodothiora populina]|uniref:Amine oxidase domain-containing protein n=1 Tax=Neodothiora populina TaxID=2781224 RepID=A0ABR3P3S8_9PEZI
MWGKNMAIPNGLSSSDQDSDTQSRDMLRNAVAKGTRKLHVGIVGAGFAGLRCADVLLSRGHKVTIFEAKGRVGGRVGQSKHLGHAVDLGPNWIHGTKSNPMLKLAKETNTTLHDWDERQQIYSPDGQLLSTEEAGEYGALIWDDGLIASAFKYSRSQSETIDPNTSLLDYFKSEVKGLFTDLPAAEAEKKRQTLLHVCEFWGSYVGSPVFKQSLKYFWLEECIEGENPFVAGTYEKILEHVARPALEGAEVRYESVVTEVHGADEQSGNMPRITVKGGQTEAFDEVVVTTPLGWLKRNMQVFKPALTPEMVNAIESLGYGSLDKVYVTFPEAFWDSSSSSSSSSNGALDPKHTTPNVTATTQPLHQSPNSDASTTPSTKYPGFTTWLSPTYNPHNAHNWQAEAMNLAALPPSCAHPTFLFYLYGPCASHIGSLISSSSSPAAADSALLEYFEPYFSRLPNYDPASPACKPSAVLATNWVSDEFAGYGSYCNFQVGLENGDGCIETLRRGLPERGVWFAGEHTAPFVALGTSTGAWWSGDGVAERICGGEEGRGRE